ncbi:15-hydroxyprostaglandin dehydrogenase [NAD(+)]-like [Manduca sexta]|uniref:15-hydroxyprostaglandin dehydrogenase [NAD(+)]-like n=1 Tax=Manduca sexta TaxID=7130 RepID=UPI001182BF1A|nr:15-hydroxyprostaglandin dehydrogenase [NAD(+)]-like [Manduca sexta]
MERDLKNKVVVITGGAQGIGHAIAIKFLTQSAKVIILDLNERKGNEVVKTLAAKFGDDRVAFIKCDVTKDLDEVSSKIFKDYKHIDVLVNNAGIANELDLRAILEVNTIAVIEWTMKFREHMRTDKGGKGGTIINMSSLYGYVCDAFLPFYKASKHAVLGFTKTIGHERNYSMTGVRVVAICPGYTKSQLTDNIKNKDVKIPEEDKEDYAEYVKTMLWQEVDVVGNATEEVFRVADSGSSWAVIGGQPIEKVPYTYL